MRPMTTLTALVLACTVSGAGALAQKPPQAQSIVNRASAAAYYQGKDGKAAVHMSIKDSQGRERKREFVILRTDVDDKDNGDQRFYVYFNRPADVSRTVFMVWKHAQSRDDRWLYLPALDLVKRIAPGDERTSFVGSDFFYEDVSGRGPTEDSHALIETTDVYFVIESTPKQREGVEFAKYRAYIHKTTFIPVKIEYFDDQGTVYRTYEAVKVETIQGFPTVVESRMTNVASGGSSSLRYSRVEYDIGLPREIFTERYLRNPPRRHLR